MRAALATLTRYSVELSGAVLAAGEPVATAPVLSVFARVESGGAVGGRRRRRDVYHRCLHEREKAEAFGREPRFSMPDGEGDREREPVSTAGRLSVPASLSGASVGYSDWEADFGEGESGLNSYVLSEGESTVKRSSASSRFVPAIDRRSVRLQSYCRVGRMPGFRRTRFLRLLSSQLQCFTRDLAVQLWAVDVRSAKVKLSAARKRVVIFVPGRGDANHVLSFYLASPDVCSSWARALGRASRSPPAYV